MVSPKIILCSSLGTGICALVFGAAMIIVACIIQPLVKSKVRDAVTDMTPIAEGSSTFDLFEYATPVTAKYYFFHVTNPDLVIAGAAPEVQQRGPYCYTQQVRRYNFTTTPSPTGETIEFNTEKINTFDAACSGTLSDSDIIMVPNYALFAVAAGADTLASRTVLNLMLMQEPDYPGPFMARSVKELLWGYTDPLLVSLKKVKPAVNPFLALQHNASIDPSYPTSSVFTGKDDLNTVGKYVTFRGEPSLSIWNSVAANTLLGTDGSRFEPFTTCGPHSIFVDVLSRSIDLVCDPAAALQEVKGIDLMRFSFSPNVLLNASQWPANAGYFNTERPSGVLNMSAVLNGAPLFVSKPCFLDAHPSYAAAVVGLPVAKASIHDFFLDVEPWTGNTMRAAARLQIGVSVTNFDLNACGTAVFGVAKSSCKTLPTVMLPIVWLENSAVVPDDVALEFREKLSDNLAMARIVALVLGPIGGVLFIFAVVLLFWACCIFQRAAGVN